MRGDALPNFATFLLPITHRGKHRHRDSWRQHILVQVILGFRRVEAYSSDLTEEEKSDYEIDVWPSHNCTASLAAVTADSAKWHYTAAPAQTPS